MGIRPTYNTTERMSYNTLTEDGAKHLVAAIGWFVSMLAPDPMKLCIKFFRKRIALKPDKSIC